MTHAATCRERQHAEKLLIRSCVCSSSTCSCSNNVAARFSYAHATRAQAPGLLLKPCGQA
jgi:hypothetical protein